MIHFRCWYCNRAYAVAESHQYERRRCACGQRYKVPKRSHGNSRARTFGEWAIEVAVYGMGGGTLGFILGVVIGSRLPYFRRSLYLIGSLTLIGFLFGLIGGERGINWIGRTIRSYTSV